MKGERESARAVKAQKLQGQNRKHAEKSGNVYEKYRKNLFAFTFTVYMRSNS